MALTQTQITELQTLINRLDDAKRKIFLRKAGDPGAIDDFLFGQEAIACGLRYLQQIESEELSGSLAHLIKLLWRLRRLGPTLGTGMGNQVVLGYLFRTIDPDPRLDWKGMQPVRW
ncbi:MAG TPA: hypothetical protein PKW02_03260 [Pseudomonadales bacterium]|jgi:hypothetical protein|nr:hypothetical protein [Pseudomonadales bacterium]